MPDEDGGGNLPLALLFVGLAFLFAYMAFRPWPQSNGKPIKPGAYAVDVVRGTPPAAGPQAVNASEVQLIEAGIYTLLALWAANKAAGVASGIGGIIGAIGGAIGGLFKGGAGEDVPPIPEVL